tara:strand:- start:194 stop:1102 length:909 start_codon:yes stop_codon:yes gene_type:complete
MKKLIYILIVYITSVNITGELFSSSTLIMFLGYYIAVPIIFILPAQKLGLTSVVLFFSQLPLINLFKLSFIKSSIDNSYNRHKLNEQTNKAFSIILEFCSFEDIINNFGGTPLDSELILNDYSPPDEQIDLFNKRVSKKLKKDLIESLNSIVDLPPNEFYDVFSGLSLVKTLSVWSNAKWGVLTQDIIMNIKNDEGKQEFSAIEIKDSKSAVYKEFLSTVEKIYNKKPIVFKYLELPEALSLKYAKAIKEYDKINNRFRRSLKEFNESDKKSIVTNVGFCPKCYKGISPIATKCPHCTADLG